MLGADELGAGSSVGLAVVKINFFRSNPSTIFIITLAINVVPLVSEAFLVGFAVGPRLEESCPQICISAIKTVLENCI